MSDLVVVGTLHGGRSGGREEREGEAPPFVLVEKRRGRFAPQLAHVPLHHGGGAKCHMT